MLRNMKPKPTLVEFLNHIMYTQKEFDDALYKDKLKLKCMNCQCIFDDTKKEIWARIRKHKYTICCGSKCKYKFNKVLRIDSNCKYCNKLVSRKSTQHYKTQRIYKNTFCNNSCSAYWNNSNRELNGIGVSKLETWIQEKLTVLYPDIKFEFNQNTTINSQLDIFIPSLKLAFELNGAFHYEPIFGKEKLDKIQNNDQRKFQACLEREIELCIIDTSTQKTFSKNTSQSFLDIIVNIINQKMEPRTKIALVSSILRV